MAITLALGGMSFNEISACGNRWALCESISFDPLSQLLHAFEEGGKGGGALLGYANR